MDSCPTFYLCPTCFEAAESRAVCHGDLMICCDNSSENVEQRKPLADADGNLRSQAPRWFLRAQGWVRGRAVAGA
ncbi:MAG: hypothetical protein ACOC9V_07080 [Chloroflexota bacterium]